MVVYSGSVGCWTQDEWPPFQCSAKPGRASSLKNKNPPHLLLEHAGAPRAAAPPCTGAASAASPPRVGEASPQQVWAAASSLPRFLDGSLDAMRLLEEEEDLGFNSW
jgi:hypothetical protein